MTSDEMQRTMEFVVDQQVRSTSKIDALAETQTRNLEGIRGLLSIAEIHEREASALNHQVSSASRDVGSLAETIGATDDHLNPLINVVERHISEGLNGKQ